jgi:glycosyltransferase involved in cell wall biosynthesis
MMAGGPTSHIWASRYRIGYWAYELPRLPESWLPALSLLHEVWTPSAYVADAVRAANLPRMPKIRVVPHPLPDLNGVKADREGFSLGDAFTFLTMFDLRSALARKNPMGAVVAFQRAFDPKDHSVELLLKAVFGRADPVGLAALRTRIHGWPNIRLVEGNLSDARTLDLIATADALLSLHRAEGFGLPVAEAMALGVPAVITGWSATHEFAEGGAAEVPYTLIPVDDESGRYGGDGLLWADPDLDAAAALMQRLARDPQYRAELSANAKRLAYERLGRPIAADGLERFIRRKSGQ